MLIPKAYVPAVEATFPSGAFMGQPVKTVPPADYVSPGISLPADYLNYFLNQVGLNGQVAQDVAVSAALSNWGGALTTSGLGSSTGIATFTWHPWLQQWIAVGTTASPNCKAFTSHDNGRTWAATSVSVGAICQGIAAPSSGTDYLLAVNGSAGHGFVNSANTLTTVAALLNLNIPGAFEYFNFANYVYVSGYQSGSTYTGIAVYLTGGTWTDIHTSLPASWQSGTCNVSQYIKAASTLATDGAGPRMLIAMCGTTVGTDTNKLALMNSSFAFTDVTPSFMSGTTVVVTGITYSDALNTWGVLCHDGASSYLYSTQTPNVATSWTLIHTFVGATTSGGLSALGSVWAAQIGAGSDNRIMLSNTVASGTSCTWTTANANLGSAGTHLFRGNGLLGFSLGGGNYHLSNALGFGPQGQY